MAEDRSLDEFLDSGDEQETSDEASMTDSETASDAKTDASAAAPDAETDGAPPDEDETASVTPATTTYAWTDAGAACAECGATVTRRWEQDGSLVCNDCKEW